MSVADEERSRFSENDLAVILQRAARHSVEDGTSPRRYTLDEIEQIASQAGIGATAVRTAVREFSARREGSALWGAGTRFRETCRVRGEAPESSLPHLVNTIENEAGTGGLAQPIVGGVVWRSRDSGGLFTVTVTNGGGSTEITATADREREGRLAILGGLVAGTSVSYLAGAILSAHTSTDLAISIAIVLFPATLVGSARMLRARLARRWQRMCARVANALEHRISSAGTSG